jgi:hypothetical protein
LGAPSWLKSEITATGSVADRIDPSRSASDHDIDMPTQGAAKRMIAPMIAVEMRSPGIASVSVGPRFARSAFASRWKADWKISVGRKTKKTTSGVTSRPLRGARSWKRSAIAASRAPTTTSATVKGIFTRLATASTMAAIVSRTTKAPTSAMIPSPSAPFIVSAGYRSRDHLAAELLTQRAGLLRGAHEDQDRARGHHLRPRRVVPPFSARRSGRDQQDAGHAIHP